MMKNVIALLLVTLICGVAYATHAKKEKKAFQTVNSETFNKRIHSKKVLLLDVRTQSEYDEGHLANATLIDVKSSDFLQQVEEIRALRKKKAIAVYCRSGRRSSDAAQILTKAGFQVINLDGGILQWVEDHRPTVK